MQRRRHAFSVNNKAFDFGSKNVSNLPLRDSRDLIEVEKQKNFQAVSNS